MRRKKNKPLCLRVARPNDPWQLTPERLVRVMQFLVAYLADDNGLALCKTLIGAAKQLLGVYGVRGQLWRLPADYEQRLIACGIDPETWLISDRTKLARAWQELLEGSKWEGEPPAMMNLAVKDSEQLRAKIAGADREMRIPKQAPETVKNHHLQRQIRDHFFDPLE